MSEEDKTESEKSSDQPPEWEDSHTAASLPSWWRQDEEPSSPPAKPSLPSGQAAPPPPPPSPAAAPPPVTPPAEWEGSPTAKELPTWWRPEQASADAHRAPTIPPVPPAMPPAPAPNVPQTPTGMQPPMAAPVSPPMQATPPAARPAPPPPPATKHAPPSQLDKTMVLGVLPTAPPMAILTVMSGPDMGFRFRIKPAVVATMGRDMENEVVLDDPATSRHHAQIQFRDGTYVLIDLGSANGTLVNDQRVTERALSDGDRIKVGQDEIVISIM